MHTSMYNMHLNGGTVVTNCNLPAIKHKSKHPNKYSYITGGVASSGSANWSKETRH